MHELRRVGFEGPVNFRDLGGYASSFGGTVRWRTIYRSDGLHHLTAADAEVFQQLSIASVFDLRSDAERDEFPDPVQAALNAIEVAPSADVNGWSAWLTATTRAAGEAVLLDHYRGYLAHGAPAIGRLLGELASGHHHPAVIHCMAGKDRTGVAVGILLSALGVGRADILDDYAISATYRSVDLERPFVTLLEAEGLSAAAIEAMLSSPRHLLATALDEIDREHGSVEAYLTGPCGLTADAIERLREALLAPATGPATP